MKITYTQFAEVLMEYVEDLITASPKETWNKLDLLVLLNMVKNDQAIASLLAAHDNAASSMR